MLLFFVFYLSLNLALNISRSITMFYGTNNIFHNISSNVNLNNGIFAKYASPTKQCYEFE